MAVRVKAKVKRELLIWTRETAGFGSIAEAAERVGVSVERLSSWESGDDAPTIGQLRTLARVYRRPLSVFYLQEVPRDFLVVRDLRRLPGVGLRRFSPELLQEVRVAQQRRELALELQQDLGEGPTRFALNTSLDQDPERVGQRVRAALGVSATTQARWSDRDGRSAYNAWRERIEGLGVLVFQITRIEMQEASGFALSDEVLPTIAVNRKAPLTRRTFTLLHEFAHLMLRISSVSDFDVDAARPPEDQRVEIFCNQVAAATLIPRDSLLREAIVMERGSRSVAWSDQEISALARVYGVSREALVRRLLTFERTTAAFYRQKRSQYLAEMEAEKIRQLGEEPDFKRNMPQEAMSNIGKPFIRMVLGNYYQDRLTLSEVSGYLGVRTRHVPALESATGVV